MTQKKILAFALAVLVFISSTPAIAGETYSWLELQKTNTPINAVDAENVAQIQRELQTLVQGKTVGFYYEDINSGESYGINDTGRFTSASLKKLPETLAIYELAAKGEISLDTELTYQSKHYYGGSGIMQKHRVGSRYSIRTLVQYAIKHSDNIASNMILEELGDRLYSYAAEIGGVYVDEFNALEVSVYLKRLFAFSNESPALGQELLGYFVNTDFEDRIPAATPNVRTAHKVGMIPAQSIYNDGAIVFEENPYILVIMTSGAQNNRTDFFVKLAKLVNQLHHEAHPPVAIDYIQVQRENSEFMADSYYLDGEGDLMLPIAAVLNGLGIPFQWDGALGCIRFAHEKENVYIFVQNSKIYLGLNEEHYPTALRQGKSYISASFITDILGADVRIALNTPVK